MVEFPTGQEKAKPALGVYVHVPFCATTCDFCAFYQTVPKGDAIERYIDGVGAEAALSYSAAAGDRGVETMFWGGGTPGLLPARAIERLGGEIIRRFGRPASEWTVEVAPATVTEDRIKALRMLGVTRLSLGAQSFQPAQLEALGRQHTVTQVRRAYDLIRSAGFESVNIDLMFALPGQAETEWQADVEEAVQLAPDHLSTYCLTFEEDTALWVKLSQGRVRRDPEKEAALYLRTWEWLESAGYAQYEISNFARPGHDCLHNLNTWRMQEWIGLGPSAASQHGGWRGSNPPDLALWHEEIAKGTRATREKVALTAGILAADSVVFGLRMNAGVSLPALRRRFPSANWGGFLDLVPRLLFEGLVVDSAEGRLRLTSRGRLLADAIGSEILEAFETVPKVSA